jgi:hypothetical protein
VSTSESSDTTISSGCHGLPPPALEAALERPRPIARDEGDADAIGESCVRHSAAETAR